MSFSSRLIACSSYLPKKILTNHDLAKMVDTSDDWIAQRTGISERRIAAKEETSAYMAIQAAQSLLEEHDIDPEEIDLIISSSTTLVSAFPSISSLVQKEIGAKNAMCFTIQEACSGFIYGMTIADKFIKSGSHKTALVIGAEKMSDIVDWSDRNTCVLFGDGAGCVLLKATDSEKGTGMIDSICMSDGTLSDILMVTQDTKKVCMIGAEVFRHAVTKTAEIINQILQRNSLDIANIKMIIPHQANNRIMAGAAKIIGCSLDKFASTIKHHGNTSSASVPLALHEMIRQNKVSTGDTIIMQAIGAGMNWGAILIKL